MNLWYESVIWVCEARKWIIRQYLNSDLTVKKTIKLLLSGGWVLDENISKYYVMFWWICSRKGFFVCFCSSFLWTFPRKWWEEDLWKKEEVEAYMQAADSAHSPFCLAGGAEPPADLISSSNSPPKHQIQHWQHLKESWWEERPKLLARSKHSPRETVSLRSWSVVAHQ